MFAVALLLISQAAEVRLYDGLGPYHRSVATKVPLASKYLDQGFDFLYGFQYAVAEKSFKEAARLDPDMVLAKWGIAAANANYINSTDVSPEHSKIAIGALNLAETLRSKGTSVEKDLVDAARKRFAPEGPTDRLKLDQAYSDAMREVWKAHPKDPDVGALFAESLLNLRPWHQWTLDGKPTPGTEEALETLRAVLKLNPKHPQGLHLWIHTIEGSQEPIRGLDAANKLMDLQPGLMHMQHMPAHIYDRTGNWKQAVDANLKSAAVYKRLFWRGGGLDYGHGRHLLAYAAAMRGQSDLALENASQILGEVSPERSEKVWGADYYVGMKTMFLVRFGRWDDILAMPSPPSALKFAITMWHEARGVSYAAEKDPGHALAEQAEFETARKKAIEAGANGDEREVMKIAGHIMAGEVLVCDGKSDGAIKELEEAVKAEDGLEYGEPPIWIQPTRHTLGAALLDADRFEDALPVFKKDLRQHPNNGWALYGLYRAYSGLRKDKEAAKALSEFKKAWEDADFEISSSCMCLPMRKKAG